jgi:hypothetical protein
VLEGFIEDLTSPEGFVEYREEFIEYREDLVQEQIIITLILDFEKPTKDLKKFKNKILKNKWLKFMLL